MRLFAWPLSIFSVQVNQITPEKRASMFTLTTGIWLGSQSDLKKIILNNPYQAPKPIYSNNKDGWNNKPYKMTEFR